MRYYTVSGKGLPLTVNTGNTVAACSWVFPVPMRIAPAIDQLTTTVYGVATGPNTTTDWSSTNASVNQGLLSRDTLGATRIRLDTLGANPVANGYYVLETVAKFYADADF